MYAIDNFIYKDDIIFDNFYVCKFILNEKYSEKIVNNE